MFKERFVRYLGSAFWNGHGISMYRDRVDGGAFVQPENVEVGEVLGPGRRFSTVEEAEEWFQGLGGNNMVRIIRALAILSEQEDPRA